MDKNSLILEIKNDLNSIKKQVEVTLAKLTVLESMIELDNKLGISVAEPVEAPVEELGVKEEPKPEPIAEPEPVVEEEITPNSNVELRNLMSIIGLNDRFRFRHDLFSNSDEIFKEAINILNRIETFTQAVEYLEEKFQWDPEADTVVYFYDIIKPKFKD